MIYKFNYAKANKYCFEACVTKLCRALILITLFFFVAFKGSAQEYQSFTRTYPSGDSFRYQTNMKGDLSFIGNSIMNRDGGTSDTEPNDAYNNLNDDRSFNPASNRNTETGGYYNYNDYKNMRYVDVDNDVTTFSSSSATFSFTDASCSRIRYAALYWSATYPRDNTADASGTARLHPINEVKIKVPGGVYVDVIADEILYDGLTNTNLAANAPYACYADITALITAQTNPEGIYTIANIPAVQGVGYDLSTGTSLMTGGSAGGWTLVVAYENPNLTGKLITTFDGFARVTGSNSISIDYNGFTTIPTGPVNANIGAAALEGDFAISGDRMQIRAALNSGSPFYSIQNTVNPQDNFFNSNITLNGFDLAGRNPASENTLGFDSDFLNLPTNTIPNNETAATFRFSTNGDQFYPFFNSFNIEIIEPNIILEKRVEDIAGNDITGLGVNLGQTLDYVLSFENTGNDDADNFTIRDILPINVTLDEAYFLTPGSLPTGVTYSYDASTRTVLFIIPNNIVTDSSPISSIRMRVRVAENCFDFVDACTDLIQNLAYATYQGIENDNQITDDPSVTDFDNCGFTTPGATNFLLDDLSACSFRRTTQLCGDNVILDAGNNFDAYVWVRDDNNNGTIEATDTVINDGDPDNDPSTIVVTQVGTYIVDKIIADPCKGFMEIIDVELFGSTQTNPILDYYNDLNSDADATNDIRGEVVVDCNDGTTLFPKIFLCGVNDSQLLQVNISDAQGLFWEKLDESSCTVQPEGCLNRNLSCTWDQVGTGSDFTANTEGNYRLSITYLNGCVSRFYFDVFQNNLDIEYTSRDLICSTDGNITITNLGTGYGYQLIDIVTNTIVIPFSANNGPSFDFTTNGAYRVEVTQLDPSSGNPIQGACIFSTPDIGILNRAIQVNITTTEANCNAQGSIQVDALNVFPNYSYELRLDDGTPPPVSPAYPGHPGGTFIDDETAQPNNTYTFNVNEGDYFIITRTDDGCIDVQSITVNRIPDPTLTALTVADIGCSAGSIELSRTGGQGNPDFQYAIWSKDGVLLHSPVGTPTEQEIVDNIDPNAYQVETIFSFGWRDTDNDGNDEYFAGENGVYVFVILDANRCYAISNPVTINDNGVITIDTIDEVQPSCSGDADGQLTINVLGGVGPFQYSIDNGSTYQNTATFVGLNAGPYELRVLDNSGCNISSIYNLNEPFPLSASAGVSRDATCDPSGAEVRITNVVGGSGIYEYSFNGGSTWGTNSTNILPPGDYTVLVSDGSCSFPMNVTVEGLPAPPNVALTPEVNYNCDGTGTITASPSISGYDYRYELDGAANTPDPASNVFTNVMPGTYTVTTYYKSQTPPTPSLLLSEDFGYGNTIPNPNTSSAYYYENQLDDVTPSGSPRDNNRSINDYEYAVTSNIERPFDSWFSPVDHTTGTRATQGRYLAVNLGDITDGQTIYEKPINDIIPNQNLIVSLWAINLVRANRDLGDPNLTIELRHPVTNALIASANTGEMPETGLWQEFPLTLNPGANTTLNLVITSTGSVILGSDVAIDDIEVLQTPEICELFVDTPVTVAAGQVFGSSLQSSTNATCNGLMDGTITFQVENFDTVTGLEYSEDGGVNWILAMSSPVTTNAVYGAGNQTVLIRKANEITCTTSVSALITAPSALVAIANVTTALTCTNGATITANASGGTAIYNYQLEDAGGVPIGSFDFTTNGTNRIFSGLTDGTYVLRVRDANNCEETASPVTIDPLNLITFSVTETLCYSGANDATIQVDVSNGNGSYQFRINTGPWLSPSPTSNATYTFNNLSSGTYDIEVRDGSGCTGVIQTTEIDVAVTVSASAAPISACDTFTTVTLVSSGGDSSFQYAIVPDGATPTMPDYDASTVRTISTPGDYDIYLRDPSGGPSGCVAFTEITIVQDPPIIITASPTDVTCFGGSDGAIAITVNSGGQSPFVYSIDGGINYVTGTNFPNLNAGTYPVIVRDANLCVTPVQNVVVNEPNQLVAEAIQTQEYTCAQLGQITIGTITPTTGGSGDYQYRINGGSWTTTTSVGHTFTDLSDGTYTISVRDANATNCFVTLADVVINPLPVVPIVDYTVSYNCDGTGNVSITPFDNSFIYILDGTSQGPGVLANIFNNISIGTHTLRVTYSPDCHIDTTVIVEDGNAFEASVVAFDNLDCNADASGSITIDAANYGAGGFEYSINGAPFVGPYTSTQTINSLNAQTHTIVVQDANNPTGCTIPLNQVLTEPAAIVVSASLDVFTCNNGGATITASAIGGTPTYVYQLEDDLGNSIIGYDFATNGNNTIFSGITVAGNYIVRARDINNCSDEIDAAITVADPTIIVFDATPTACYTGNNDGSIVVNVTTGNGGYQFRRDGGPWMTPTPLNATTYTFEDLANGSYDIEVRDQFGCPLASNMQTVSLDPNLNATVVAVDISSCADGSITVNATGGDGNFVYAFMPTGNVPALGDFGVSNTLVVTTGNDGDYDIYVWDNNGIDPHCQFMVTETVEPAITLVYTATPTAPECHDGTGSITVNITAGDIPYTIELIDLDNGGASDQTNTNVVATTQNYFNLAVGNYTIIVTDANGCDLTETPVNIINPVELIADIQGEAPINCDPDPNLYGFTFINYPTSIGTLEFSADGGANWQSADTFVGVAYSSGTVVEPAIRTVSGATELCRTDLPRYTIPYPLDDLDISIFAIIVDCNDLQVTVQGTEGLGPYEYTYSENPVTFNPATAIWQPGGAIDSGGLPVPAGNGAYVFTGLVPGRTYVFYVRDSSPCVRQSSQNVNILAPPPVQITSDVTPTCDALTNGQITYTVTETTLGELGGAFTWDFYRLDDVAPVGAPVLVTSGTEPVFTSGDSFTVPNPASLGTGDYFVEIRGAAPNNCVIGSENAEVEALDPITFTPNVLSHITCANPGLIEIQNPQGGGGTYTYTLSSINFITDIVSTSNPIEVPIANLVDVTATPFNVLVEIADQYNCPVTTLPSHTVSMDISQSPNITSVSTTNCTTPFGITVTASGGTAPYLYSINGGTNYLNNGGVFNNVAVGSYMISIIDANGCTAVDTAEIYPVLQASAVQTKNLDCTLAGDAIISISATDGSGSYDYEIDGPGVNDQVRTTLPTPANSEDWSTAVAGTYTVLVYDNNRAICPARSFTIEVPVRLEPIIDTINTTNITCIGANDGTITISAVDNAIGPYTFEITSLDGGATSISPTSTTNTSATFTGLAPSVTLIGYIVTITGNLTTNNCPTNSASITIAEPIAMAVTMNTPIEFGCTIGNNPNNAIISVQNVIGGSNTFVRYQFFNDLDLVTPLQDGSNDTYIETNIAGGNYTIVVFDDNGCQGSATATIAPFDELLTPSIIIDQVISCIAGENITINAFGSITDSSTLAGLANYEFRQLPNAFTASNGFINLNTGTHNFEVRNIHTNCVISISHTVGEPNNFEIISTTTDVVCDGTDGSVSLTINDPINPFVGGFSWQLYDSQGTVTTTDDIFIVGANGVSATVGPTTSFALTEGQYRVEIVQDSNPNCTTSDFFVIAGPNGPITGNTQIEVISCAFNDGVIEVIDAQGGWGTYTYFVAPAADPAPVVGNFVANPRFTGLSGTASPGTTYQVWIKDQNDCMQQLLDVNLSIPDPISANLQINQGNCTDFSGEIEVVAVTGGQGSNYTYQLLRDGSLFGAPQATRIFSGLGAGTYEVQITDQLTCAATSTAVILYEVITPRADIIKTIDCNSGGEITITQTGGSGTFNYIVTFPDASNPQPPVLGSASATFTNLTMVGDYAFTITDTVTGNTCSTTVTQSLEDSVLPNINIDAFTNVTCNGADDATITVNANPDNGIGPYIFTIISGSGGATFPILPTSTTDATAVFTGLEGSIAGITYTIRVTSPNGCSSDITQVISQPNVISNFTTSMEQFACTTGNNPNTASITVDELTLSGGSNNFVRYRFVNTTTATTVQDGPNTTYVETNYAGGVYEITAFDDMGCESLVVTETINPFVEILDPIITDITPVTCNPGNDAQIQVNLTINPSAAIPNLNYVINGINVTYTDNNSTGLFTGLSAGNYSINITNVDTGCTIDTVHTIDQPLEMQVVATKLTDEECLNNGVDDGSFSVGITGYIGAYSYQVFDANNNPIVAQTGNGNTAVALPPITGLSGGSYYVRITQTEAPFCIENSNVITIIAPEAPISAVISEEASVSCANDQGSILVSPEGGNGPYTITLINTNSGQAPYIQTNVSAFIFTSLSAGDFDIIIEDSYGCVYTNTGNITLVRPDDIVPTISANTLVCFGDDTATITATVGARNVTSIYQYQLNVYSDMTSAVPQQISVAQTAVTFDNLDAGFYSVTVSDDNGCSAESNRIQIIDPSEVSAQLLRTSALTCALLAELELTATGGTGPYSFSTDGVTFSTFNQANGPNTHVFTGMSAGTYSYYVQDAFNCNAIQSNEITEDPIMPLTMDVDSSAAVINCTSESTAIIYVEALGGLGNYQYELYTDISLSAASRVLGPQTLGEFTGLSAGTYFVNVTSEDCTVSAERVEIIEPTPLTYIEDVVDVSCNGEDDGSIAVTLSGGAGGYQYAISPNLSQFDSVNTFTDLEPGDYTIIAQDQNGCFEQLLYTIVEPAILILDATPLPEVCAGSSDGSITLNITGGTAPYSTSLNSNNTADFVQDRLLFNGLPGDNYLVFVRDANGCETNVVVDITSGVNLNAMVEPVYECSGDTPDNYVNITLEDQTIIGEVLYALDSTNPADMRLNPDFRNSSPGMHFIAVAHANGCIQTFDFEIENFEPLTLMLEQNSVNEITALAVGGREGYTFYFDNRDNGEDNTFIIRRTDTYVVTVVDENGCEAQANIFIEFIDIEIPNFFTPDGDGQNDAWLPRNQETFPEILTIIFDRYGREVYRMGINDAGWDGLYNQTELPTGDYWYIIKLNANDDDREFVGHFTLYR